MFNGCIYQIIVCYKTLCLPSNAENQVIKAYTVKYTLGFMYKNALSLCQYCAIFYFQVILIQIMVGIVQQVQHLLKFLLCTVGYCVVETVHSTVIHLTLVQYKYFQSIIDMQSGPFTYVSHSVLPSTTFPLAPSFF